MKETMQLEGVLRGHSGWVTQIATNPLNDNMLISSSRDKTIIVWALDGSGSVLTGKPIKSLHGHGHFVSDVVMSSTGEYALSGSWDKTLRLWDLNTGQTTHQFVAHTQDVLSVAFSTDDRLIVSGARDKKIKLWNTLAQCKYTIVEDCHNDWVSTVRFSPSRDNPVIVSAGWDKLVKVWNLGTCRLKTDHVGHTGYVNTVAISPNGSFCASGGKDGSAMLWDLKEGNHLYTLGGNDVINSLAFSPKRGWLCAAAGPAIKIWDLEAKNNRLFPPIEIGAITLVDELQLDSNTKSPPQCISLAWSTDGQTLFAGYTDNCIRMWRMSTYNEEDNGGEVSLHPFSNQL